MLGRWQELLSSLIEIATADAGRILQIDRSEADVICSLGDGSITGERILLADHGVLPAEVIKRSADLEVPNLRTSDAWRDGRDARRGIASYLGMPIRWPDDTLFGVMDIYNHAPLRYSAAHHRLMSRLRDSVEEHLLLLWEHAADHGKLSTLARRSEEALRASEERFRLLVENALDDFFLHDDKGRFLDVNARACTSLGYTREELLRMSAVDVSTDLTQAEKEKIWQEMQPGSATTVYSHHRRKDGSTFPVEVRISCHFIDDRKLFLGLVRDITERVEAEQAVQRLTADLERRVAERTFQLRNMTDTLQAVMDGANDAIFLKDNEKRFLLFNRAAERMSGYKSSEVLGKTAEDLFGKEAGGKIIRLESKVLESGQTFTVEETLRMPEGERIFLATRSPRKDENGKVIGLVGISRDITDRKAAETELQIERNRLALAAEVSGLGVWDYDIATNTLYCDPQWYRIIGRDPANPIKSIEDFRPHIHPEDVERATAVQLTTLSELVTSHRNYGIVFRIVRPNGDIRWIRSAACLIDIASGVPNRAIGVIVDITDAHLAEQKLQSSYQSLRQAEKLARIGSWVLDLKTGKFSGSEMLYEMNGADPNGPALTPQDLQRLLSQESYAKVNKAIEDCARTGEPYGIDAEHMRPDGSRFAVHIRGQAVRDPAGQIVALTGTVQDISEREEARARLAALADNVPNGAIYRLEPTPEGKHIYAYFSAGIERLTGVAADAIVDDARNFERIVHEEDRDIYSMDIGRALADRRIFDSTFRVRRQPDGAVIHMHSRAVPRQQTDDNVAWDGIIRDITAERLAAETLAQAKVAAEAAVKAKSDFLATMSHEIRTPMNSVIGMTRLALQTGLSEKQRNYLEKIDSSARALLGIINDILDFSKIEAGGLELEDSVFAFEAVLDAVTNATALRAEEKGLEIIYSVAPDVPRTIRGDSLRLSQILINLVGNAVKFTHEGDILVTVELVQKKTENGEGNLLQFSVRDTGIGLDAGQIANLFRPFTQADAATSKRYGGTGLGLSICKQLVEKMGGTIEVESTPGEGSLFRFNVALKPLAATAADETRTVGSLQGHRVLVVDDNDSARTILVDMVKSFGMAVWGVASAMEALDELHAASEHDMPYDLVLMDWRMPEIDGLEAARLIRSDPQIRHMPAVLMVTAYGREEVLQQMEALDLQGLLIKPVTESMMFNTIQHIFATGGETGVAAAASSYSNSRLLADETRKRLSGSRVLVVDDNSLNREVVTDFLTLAGVTVETAASGVQALDRLAHHAFDAVLMDLHMPEMDGLEATRRIRENPAWASLPVIALTAQARIEDREATLGAGMVAHLSKPIDEQLLYNTLAEVLAGPLKTEPARADDEHTNTDPSVVFDANTALTRLGRNPDRFQRLLNGFLRDFADLPERIDTAFHSGKLDEIAALAHLVKGPAGYLCAFQLARSADDLERSAQSHRPIGQIHANVEDFTARAKEALYAIQNAANSSQPAGPIQRANTTMDIPQAIALLEQIEPLLARGDYAATQLLARLAEMLEGYEEAARVEQIRTLYDDLELNAASEAMSALKRQLRIAVTEPKS